jgi:hypothetical protein
MIRLLFLTLLSLAFHWANSQKYTDLRVGLSYLNAASWNETIRTYNDSRFWQENDLPELKGTFAYGLGFSGVAGKGLFLSPSIQYSKFTSQTPTDKIDLHWVELELACDIFPLEFGMDSVHFRLRPFVRLGYAGSMLLTRIRLADGNASIDGEPYEPYNWPYILHAALGLRYQPTSVVGFFLLLDARFAPNARINEFRTALLGSNYLNSSDQNNVRILGIQSGITFRIKN